MERSAPVKQGMDWDLAELEQIRKRSAWLPVFLAGTAVAGRQIYSKVIKSDAYGKPVGQITRDDLVTEHEIELPFNAGKEFKVSFWPTATSKGGYKSGREVIVRLAN